MALGKRKGEKLYNAVRSGRKEEGVLM